jgi:hypothetical protein
MPQGQVLPLRLRSRNAEAVKGRQIVVRASGREPPRGDLAVKIALWTGARTLQGGVQGRQMDRFRHKSRCLDGGLEALDGRRIRMATHVHDRDRRGVLNVPRGVNAVHGPL